MMAFIIQQTKFFVILALAALGLVFLWGTDSWDLDDRQRRTKAVAFDSPDLTLRGTLELPRRATPTDPVPAVLFVHGSGPNDRNQSIEGRLGMSFPERVQIFSDIANSIAEAGYASLRYDKRTCGPFNGCADNGYPLPSQDISVMDFVEDAIAAADFLRKVPEVDADQIVYIGHSQGGQLAFEALVQRPSLAGAVLLSAPRRSIEQIINIQADHIRKNLEKSGVPQEEIDERVSSTDKLVENLERLHNGNYDGPSRLGNAPIQFWKSWFAIADRIDERVAKLQRRVLVLLGGYDWQVPPEEAGYWKQTLTKAPQGINHSVKVLPGITHALNRITEPDWQEIEPSDIGTKVDAKVNDIIISYLDNIER